MDLARDLGVPASTRSRAGSTPRCTAAAVHHATVRGLRTPRESNERYHYLLAHGQTGLSIAFDNPTIMGYDSDTRRRTARSASAAWRSTRCVTWRSCSTASTGEGLDVDDDQRPASIMFAFYLANAEKRGVPFSKLPARSRTTFQGIHRAEVLCFRRGRPLRIIVT